MWPQESGIEYETEESHRLAAISEAEASVHVFASTSISTLLH